MTGAGEDRGDDNECHGGHSRRCHRASRVHRSPRGHLAQTANRLHGRQAPREAEKQSGEEHAQVAEHANEGECEREEEHNSPCQGSDSINTCGPCFRWRPRKRGGFAAQQVRLHKAGHPMLAARVKIRYLKQVGEDEVTVESYQRVGVEYERTHTSGQGDVQGHCLHDAG